MLTPKRQTDLNVNEQVFQEKKRMLESRERKHIYEITKRSKIKRNLFTSNNKYREKCVPSNSSDGSK